MKDMDLHVSNEKRILLYLYDHLEEQRYKETKKEFSVDLSVERIIEATGLSAGAVYKILKTLIKDGVLETKKQYVSDTGRYRNLYFLTLEGREKAKAAADEVGGLKVPVRDVQGQVETPIRDVLERMREPKKGLAPPQAQETGFTPLIRMLEKVTVLDIGAVVKPKQFIDYSDHRPEIQYFVGREKELRFIKNFFASRSKVLCIRGLAGIGKSTIVSKSLEGLESNIFWYRITNMSTLEGTLRRLSEFLLKFEKKALAQRLDSGAVEKEAALNVLKEEIKGLNAVFVFDDAHRAADEVQDLFSTLKDMEIELKIILMSRTKLHFYDRRDVAVNKSIWELDLQGLDKRSSKDLLVHRGRRKDHDAIYEKTRGHPLLLELISSGVSALTDEFFDEEVLMRLSPEERTLLETASVFRKEFSQGDLEVLLGLEGKDADAEYVRLNSLMERLLITRARSGYRIQDMLKGFFYDRIRASRKAELHRRLAERYEKFAQAGALDGMYHYVRAKEPEKAAKIAAVHGEAYLAKGHVSDMLSIAEGIVSVMKRPSAEALNLCGLARLASANVSGARGALEEALSACKSKGDRNEAQAHLELARLYDWMGELGPALEHSDAGFELASKLKDKGLVCRSLGITGRICAHTGRIKDAIRFLDLCVDGAQGDLRMLSNGYIDQGNLCIVTGDIPKAIKILDKALVAALRAKDELTLITALDLLGWAYHLKEEEAKALNYFAREISLIEGCAFRLQLPMAHCNAGLSYLGQGKKDKAMDRLTRAKELGAGLGCARLDARISDGLGTLHSLRKEWDKAEACFEEAEKALALSRDLWALGSHHMLVGDMYSRRGMRREAREEYSRAQEAFERMGNKGSMAKARDRARNI